MRAGTYATQPGGYKAFIPKPLPPNPPIKMNADMINLLARASQALGKLDGTTEILPNPNLFVAMYVRKEAVLSSQIEGTQASLIDVLQYESEGRPTALPNDVSEVVNYVRAMNYGLQRLKNFPLSLRLIREIHAELLKGVRGSERNPGEFRTSQNWIGPSGCNLKTAIYVPPPVEEMKKAMGDLEKYLYAESDIPVLIRCGLMHCQFESIHPFLDGNGRVGRLLITFYLCHQKVLTRPLLYLSYYFKQFRSEYYDSLMEVRNNGDWEGWLKFFLNGILQVSIQATDVAQKILKLQAAHRELIQQNMRSTPHALLLLDELYTRPITSVSEVAKRTGVSFPTANDLIKKFVKFQLLKELTGKQRNRLYVYYPYMDLLSEGIEESS